MTKIIGLFEDEQDLACAVEGLYHRGFNQEEIKVINPNPVSQRSMSQQDRQMALSVNPSFIGDGAITYPSPSKAQAGAASLALDPTGLLTNMGIPEAEACFYAVNVERGHKLVIIQTGNERAHEAQRIIRQAHARVSTGYE